MTKAYKKAIKNLGKECFKPHIKIDKNPEHTGSKYFGKAWLSKDEAWPKNHLQEYLTFVLQLDIKDLPEPYKTDLGGTGLFQFFFDFEYPGEHLLRIVYPDKVPGYYHKQPLNKSMISDYKIDNEPPVQKIITGWELYTDVPHSQEQFIDPLKTQLLEDVTLFDSDICATQGDKLGGYAFWTQAGASSDHMLYQLDAGCFFDGAAFEAHAPCLFAGDGTGQIYYNKEKSFHFCWDCT